MTTEYQLQTLRGILLTAIDVLAELDSLDNAREDGLEQYKKRHTELSSMAGKLVSEDYWKSACLAGNPLDDVKVCKIYAAIEALAFNESDRRLILSMNTE